MKNKFLVISLLCACFMSPALAADKQTVSVVKGGDIDKVVRKAVELVGGMEGRVKKWDRVMIKVSLDDAKASGSGLVTNVEVVRTLIKMAKEAGARRITVMDGSLRTNTWKAFEAAGYNKMAKEEGVVLKDLDSDLIWRAWLPDGNGYKKYSVATSVLNGEVFINVPVAKIDDPLSPSLSLKNMLGIMCDKWTKRRLPKGDKLDELIVDMNSIKQSDLVVVDCTSFEGMVIAGNDPIAVDVVSCKQLKLNPEKVEYIRKAAEQGIGTADISEIDVKSEKL